MILDVFFLCDCPNVWVLRQRDNFFICFNKYELTIKNYEAGWLAGQIINYPKTYVYDA